MTDYKDLTLQLKSLTEGVEYDISNLANAAALLWMSLPDINWSGFYWPSMRAGTLSSSTLAKAVS